MSLRRRPDRHEFPTLSRRPIRVVLDGVRRLPNIGTVFRLCDAFRVERLYVCGVDLQPHKRSLVTAAAGTLEWVPWEVGVAAAVVKASRAAGYSIVAVELTETSIEPERLISGAPVCLVLGAEDSGISAEVLALADQTIEVPSDGIGGSINVTSAGAIVLYELRRRFALPPEGR